MIPVGAANKMPHVSAILIVAGIVEGFNNKLKLITRKSYGFRTQEAHEIALYHNLGSLPMKKFAHEFF